VSISEKCTHSNLEATLSAYRFPAVICDCEGFDSVILDRLKVSSLTRSAVLVEVHEHLMPGIRSLLKERFAVTHCIDEIPVRERTVADLPSGIEFSDEEASWVLAEGRPSTMIWMWMLPCAAPGDYGPMPVY